MIISIPLKIFILQSLFISFDSHSLQFLNKVGVGGGTFEAVISAPKIFFFF